MVICLEKSANDLHMVQLMPLPPPSSLAPVKSGMVYLSGAYLPRLSWNRPLNGCSSGSSSLIFVFSVVAKRLAGKSISEMTYFVWSGSGM